MAKKGIVKWVDAKKDYLTDESMTYKNISKKYGVSEWSVTMRAQKEGWQDLRLETQEKTNEKLTENLSTTIAKVREDQYYLGDFEIQRALEALEDKIVHEIPNLDTSSKAKSTIKRHLADQSCDYCLSDDLNVTTEEVLGARPTTYKEALASLESGIKHKRQALGMDRPENMTIFNQQNIFSTTKEETN